MNFVEVYYQIIFYTIKKYLFVHFFFSNPRFYTINIYVLLFNFYSVLRSIIILNKFFLQYSEFVIFKKKYAKNCLVYWLQIRYLFVIQKNICCCKKLFQKNNNVPQQDNNIIGLKLVKDYLH